MIEFKDGDLFRTEATAIVNTVNCVGAMGRGVALGVKQRWPAIYQAYRRDCGVGLSCEGTPDPSIGAHADAKAPPCCAPGLSCAWHRVRPGQVIVRPTGTSAITAVIDLPTKRHWKAPSRLIDIEAGLIDLKRAIREEGLTSVALPPPGCGNGGLSWKDVGPLVVATLGGLDATIIVYAPPV